METFLEKWQEILSAKLIDTSYFTLSVYNLVAAFIVILAMVLILRVIKRIFKGFVNRNKLDAGTAHSIFLIIKYLVWVIVAIALVDSLGFKVSILIASTAALLVGVGLGLQELFRDVASGIILLVERSVKVNDIVELESDMIGRVISIGLRTSKLRTRDNVINIIPNSMLVNDRVVNWSHVEDRTRFFIEVGVKYGSDTDLVTKVLIDCAKDHPRIIQDPGAFVRFVDFGESSLDFRLFFWTNETFRVENTKSDLRYKIDEAFRRNKIEIPFPQRDLYLKSMPQQK